MRAWCPVQALLRFAATGPISVVSLHETAGWVACETVSVHALLRCRRRRGPTIANDCAGIDDLLLAASNWNIGDEGRAISARVLVPLDNEVRLYSESACRCHSDLRISVLAFLSIEYGETCQS